MASVLMWPPLERVLDARALGEAEVAAFDDDGGAQLARVDAHRVVARIGDLEVRFVARLDVGADAAVPQQVDRQAEDRAHDRPRPPARGRRCSSSARASGDSGIDLASRA